MGKKGEGEKYIWYKVEMGGRDMKQRERIEISIDDNTEGRNVKNITVV